MTDKVTAQLNVTTTLNLLTALRKGYILAQPILWKYVQAGLNFLVVALPAITYVYPPAGVYLTPENIVMIETVLGTLLSYFGFATTGKIGWGKRKPT